MTVHETGRQSLLDSGLQRDISDISREAGLFFTVFITNEVLAKWVTYRGIDSALSEGEKGIIRLIVSKLVYSLRVQRQTSKSNLIYFKTTIEKDGKSEDALLLSVLGPIDEHDQRPCITIMLPEEHPDGSDK